MDLLLLRHQSPYKESTGGARCVLEISTPPVLVRGGNKEIARVAETAMA